LFVVTEASDDGLRLEPSEGREPKLDAVEVVYFDTIEASYARFEEGGLDWSQVPADEYVEAAETFEEQYVPYSVEFWFGMNLGNPKFDNPLFREAIVHAIDRPAMVEEFYPGALLLNGVVPQGVPAFQANACGDRCVYASGVSRDLLAQAFPDGNVPTVMIDYADEEFEPAAAEAIARDLTEVGIPTELRSHPLDEYRQFVVRSEQELFFFGWVGVGETPDTYVAPLFVSDSIDNVTGYNSVLADGGIAAARTFTVESERVAAYQAVETAIMGQVPLVPLVQIQTHAVVSSRVEGLVTGVQGTWDASAVSVGD
jgi:peptide/nickel transport system substrate-binding protein